MLKHYDKKEVRTIIRSAIESRLGDEVIDVKVLSADIFAELSKDVELVKSLGEEALRSRIEKELRTYTAERKMSEFGTQGDLFGYEIQAYYADDHGKWVRTDKLKQLEFNNVCARYEKQLSGLQSHVKELNELKQLCKPIWRDHPDFTVGECVKHMDENREYFSEATSLV